MEAFYGSELRRFALLRALRLKGEGAAGEAANWIGRPGDRSVGRTLSMMANDGLLHVDRLGRLPRYRLSPDGERYADSLGAPPRENLALQRNVIAAMGRAAENGGNDSPSWKQIAIALGVPVLRTIAEVLIELLSQGQVEYAGRGRYSLTEKGRRAAKAIR